MRRSTWLNKSPWVVAFAVLSLLLGACDSGDGEGGEAAPGEASPGGNGTPAGDGEGGQSGGSITFWTVYDTADRMAAMEPVVEDFTAQSGIDVEVVGVSAPDLPQTMIASAAAGDLPDVIVHGIELTPGWVAEGILDSAAATELIEELDPSTFSEGALELVSVTGAEGQYGAVPSDGWGQMLFYRTDLFEEAGLDPPATFDDITAAAEALHGQDGLIGIVAGTKGGDGFTQQTFENLALANDCRLVDDNGEIALDSQECVNTIQFYVDLMSNYSAGGAQDVQTTRATYLSGGAAMISWSPHLLDELAGLFPDTPPTCAECADDPQWLVDRTGIVPQLQGPDADEPAQFGLTINLGITTQADTEASKEFVRYLMTDGYMGFLDIATEGRFPMRTGTPENENEFVDGWQELTVGSADTQVTVGELYGEEAIQTLVEGATGFDRWGFAEGQAELVTALSADLELTRILRAALDGSIDAATAATQMKETAEQTAAELQG